MQGYFYISNLTSEVGIERFTLPVTELPYPAITICKKNGLYDPGEYLRAVFNQFQYAYRKDDEGSCNETASLRSHYRNFVSTCDRKPRDDITAYVEKRWAEGPVSINSTSWTCGEMRQLPFETLLNLCLWRELVDSVIVHFSCTS